jgi:hypothetical protein
MVGNTGRTPDPRRIRRLKSPKAFEVETDGNGVPVRLNLGGVWQVVALARKPWRIDQHWWRPEPVQRLYFRVLPEDSPPLTIFHDSHTNSWARQEY